MQPHLKPIYGQNNLLLVHHYSVHLSNSTSGAWLKYFFTTLKTRFFPQNSNLCMSIELTLQLPQNNCSMKLRRRVKEIAKLNKGLGQHTSKIPWSFTHCVWAKL